LGSISSTCLGAAFTRTDPKSAIKTDGWTIFFPLLGYAFIKAALNMLVKLTPDVVYCKGYARREVIILRPKQGNSLKNANIKHNYYTIMS